MNIDEIKKFRFFSYLKICHDKLLIFKYMSLVLKNI